MSKIEKFSKKEMTTRIQSSDDRQIVFPCLGAPKWLWLRDAMPMAQVARPLIRIQERGRSPMVLATARYSRRMCRWGRTYDGPGSPMHVLPQVGWLMRQHCSDTECRPRTVSRSPPRRRGSRGSAACIAGRWSGSFRTGSITARGLLPQDLQCVWIL